MGLDGRGRRLALETWVVTVGGTDGCQARLSGRRDVGADPDSVEAVTASPDYLSA